MRFTRPLVFVALLLALAISAASRASDNGITPDTWTLSLDKNKWAFLVDLPGFIPEHNSDGGIYSRRSFTAGDPKTGMIVTVTLMAPMQQLTAAACSRLALRLLPRDQKPQALQTSERAPFAFAEYTIPSQEHPGTTLHLFSASLTDHELCASIQFGTPAQTAPPAFDSILATARFQRDVSASSFVLLLRGDRAYAQTRSYNAAIKAYSEAFAQEQRARRLEASRWNSLVNELALMQCWAGRAKDAIGTANEGIARDPANPLFYYDLACADARSKDEQGALENLRKSFERKDRLPPQERMPDPRRDDVFDHFMSDPEFRQQIDSLTAYLDVHEFPVPGQTWKLAMTLPVFVSNSQNTDPKGTYVFVKEDHNHSLSAAITITPSTSPATSEGCLQSLDALAKQNGGNAKPYRAAATAMYEYQRWVSTSPYGDEGYDSRVLLTCTPRELIYVFVEFSSPDSFRDSDRALFTQILNSVHAVQPLPAVAPTLQ